MDKPSAQTNFIRTNGFTLVELMVVVILVGIIAVFAVPNYTKALDKTFERNAINQMYLLHAAQKRHNERTGGYYPGSLQNVGMAAINTNLGLNIVNTDTRDIWHCNDLGSNRYNCYARRRYNSGTNGFWIILDESALDATNPCCSTSAGTCPSLPSC